MWRTSLFIYIFVTFIPVYVYVEVNEFLSNPSLYFTIHIIQGVP